MSWLWWALPLALLTFLWRLNRYLNGLRKAQVARILVSMITVICGILAVCDGWRMGLTVFVGTWVLALAYTPIALRCARMLTHGRPDLGVSRYNDRQTAMLINIGMERWLPHMDRVERRERKRLARAIADALGDRRIRQVLARNDATVRDIEALCGRMEVSGLPPRLKTRAIRNPEFLSYFLRHSEPAMDYQGKYTRNILDKESHVTLTLWAMHNPGGAAPP